jgi:Na+-transporting NADH:ubiquinone oxidoreductase subunit NqrE
MKRNLIERAVLLAVSMAFTGTAFFVVDKQYQVYVFGVGAGIGFALLILLMSEMSYPRS